MKTPTKAELILLGYAQTVDSADEVRDILEYIRGALNASHKLNWDTDKLMKDSVKYCNEYEYKAINIMTLDDMVLVSLVLKTDEDPDDWSIADPDGVLAYVYNATYPDLSELGYVYFRSDGTGFGFKRVG